MRNVESSEFSLNIFYSEVLVHSLRSDWLLIWNWLFIYFHFFPLYNYSRPAPTKDNLCYSSKVFEFDNVYFIKLGWQNWFKRPQEEKRRSKAAAAAAAAAAPPPPPPPPPVQQTQGILQRYILEIGWWYLRAKKESTGHEIFWCPNYMSQKDTTAANPTALAA